MLVTSWQPIRRWLETIAQDVRYGLRSLRRTALATSVMVASVALGIGIATAVFTLADVMLFRPLPYRAAERLVVPYQTVIVRAGARRDTIPWSLARYEVLRRSVQGFEDAGFAAWVDGIIRPDIEDKPIRIEAVTPSLLTTLSIGAQAGRVFKGDEDAADVAGTVAMISDRLWRTEYAADRSIVGRAVSINGVPVTVIGVMPRGFSGFVVGADVWLPIRMMARVDPTSRWTERVSSQVGTVIARMAPGQTIPLMQRQLEAAFPILNTLTAEPYVAADAQLGIGVITLAEARRHPLVKPMLQLMGAAVLGLMLIVCANIASILLARGHARRNEMGVRIALGASGGRVGRQVLTESMLLGALGLPPGVLLGFLCAGALASLRPSLPQTWVLLRGTDLLAGASLAPNLRVLVFSSAVAAIATLLFGIGPSVAAARVDPVKLMTSAGDSHTSAPVRGRQFLVMAQVALATILLVTAGLMTRSLRAMLNTDLGFQPNGVVTFRLSSIDTSASARIRRQEMLTQIAGAPAVQSVTMAPCVPFDLACMVTVGVRAVGNADPTARPVEVEYRPAAAD
ncbi:MAG: macB 19, partial [Geminicoccaceae bacterium]|nr:macB 19 [Geminicoccaceae bacterium]